MQKLPHDDSALVRAQTTIEQQTRKIQELQQRLEHEHFASELRTLLASAQNANIILAPFSHTFLLEMVVTTAAQVIAARSGSLFLIDEKAQDLVFEVAIGPAAQQVKKFRVPLGHGIAGIVALSGQPMAIADTPQDERLAIDIASSVNYIPENIVCVPLFYEDHIIGVLELLDKINARSFSLEDMQTLALFANIAAFAIAQSQAYHDQHSILTSLLRAYTSDTNRDALYHEAVAFSDWLNTEPINKTARDLALVVHQMIMAGEEESEIGKNVLQSIVTTVRTRQQQTNMAGI